jgi:hypothetical protein
MELNSLIERWGEGPILASGGLILGLLFGFFAQRSRFCLRAAVIEFWHGQYGEKTTRVVDYFFIGSRGGAIADFVWTTQCQHF